MLTVEEKQKSDPLTGMDADEYLLRKTVIENPYIPWTPHPQQAKFLEDVETEEMLYGGAAGGGKSVSLLAASLQFAHVSDYAAILLRRTFPDLNQPGGLIPLSHLWLDGKAKWDNGEHRWHFRNGASLSFGYLDNDRDLEQYQGASFQFIGFDELTQHPLYRYRYLFSRLRKPADMLVPLRMRSGSNPGNLYHEWVKDWFIENGSKFGRRFIPAKLEDNPSLDRESYENSLNKLDPVTRRQLRHGDWNIRPEGNLFKHEWFTNIVDAPPPLARVVRCWDFAATEPKQGRDPDWTVGVKAGLDASGNTYILDIQRFQHTPGETHVRVAQAAAIDGTGVTIRLEQEPGSSGKDMVWNYQSRLNGYAVHGVPSTGDKVTRSLPFSAACERKAVVLVRGTWNFAFLDELCAFPQVAHDDQVDAAVGAFMELTHGIASVDSGFYVLTAGR